jgi:hypothetical protein
MIVSSRFRPLVALALAGLALSCCTARAEMPPQAKEAASLVVEGAVRESFRSVRSTRVDFLYEIEVRSAQVGKAPEAPFEGVLPRSGELIYVLAFQRRLDAPRVPGPAGYLDLPAEQDVIRAWLFPRIGGGWQFAYPLGFERIGRAEGGLGPEAVETQTIPGAGAAAVPRRRLGVLVMPSLVGNRAGLQITSVTPGARASRAGLEPGDVIVEADGVPTRSLGDLTSQIARAGGKLRLLVRNVRSGQIQPTEVDMSGAD